ncbi:MAG: gliding motility-associated C-terminal domain-containing protein, partial [Bacteroidota bacterium]
NSGCTAIETVTVAENTNAPTAMITTSSGIPCGAAGITLDGTPSSAGGDITYSWTTTDGNISTGGSGTMPFVTTPGTYQLVVAQGSNGCTDTASVVVDQQANNLVVAIALPDTLTCQPTPVGLDGSGSTVGSNITYNWTTTDGNILAGTTGPLPIVDQPGTYILTVVDTDSGCSRRDSVAVVSDQTPPNLAFLTPDTLTCSQDSTFLSIAAAPDLTFSWSTNTGSIQLGAGSDSALVVAPADYFLTIRDTISGCTSTDTVRVVENTTPPLANAGPADTLTCGALTTQLDGTGSSTGNSFTYSWTTDNGNLVSGARTQVPVVDAAGAYFLEVVDTLTGCAARDTVQLASNDEAPLASVTVGGSLSCANPTQLLDGTGSSFGEGFTFAWSTTDGNFIGGTQTLMPTIDAAGTYLLTVTDTTNTCQTLRPITVTEDFALPTVLIAPDFRLYCRQPTNALSGVGSDVGAGFAFSWSSPDGNFVGPDTIINPVVDAAGIYVLSITNTVNGCMNRDTVRVTTSFAEPAAIAGPDGTLNCRDTVLTLGQNIPQPNRAFTWTTTNGSILSGTDMAQVMVTTAGNYHLLVEDTDNGCVARDSLTVSEDQALPVVMIAAPAELNCTTPALDLDGTGSSFGAPFTAAWSTNGNILAGTTGLTPTIDEPGTYRLLIQNTNNFCVDSAQVMVTGSFVFPLVEAGDSLGINCRFPSQTLDASGSDMGTGFSLLWTSADGNIVGDPSSPNPAVDAAGVYFLTVRNEVNNCAATDSVVVRADFVPPASNGGPNQTLTCTNPSLTLGLDTVTPGYQYSWFSFSGNVVSGGNGPVATVDAPGVYTFRVVDQRNGCQAVDNVTVGENTTAPAVSISQPAVLNCRDTEVVLAGQAAAGLAYTWTTASGTFVGATDQAQALVSAPGTYELEVVDPVNGCDNAATVLVAQDTAAPVLTIAPAAALNCRETTRQLQAQNLGPGFAYVWNTPNGSILSGADSPEPTVAAAGDYTLLVTDQSNFCTATNTLVVAADTLTPEVVIAPPATLTCTVRSLSLAGMTNLAPAAGTVLWTTTNGALAAGQTSLTPTVTAPGTYLLTVTDDGNGCAASTSVSVDENVVAPTIDLAENVDLGCEVADFALSASVTGSSNLTYAWRTEGGAIVAGGQTANPVINGPGVYTLLVTDTENGCVDSAATLTDQNLLLDFAFTQRDPNCTLADGTLQFGTVDGGTPPFVYSVDAGSNFRNDPVFQGLVPDNYVLVVRDANGCEVERGTSIVPAPEFELAISENALIDFGDFYQIDARINFPLAEVDTIVWTPTVGLDCTGCLNPRAAPPETQSYRVRVTTLDGCIAEGFLTIVVNEENPVYFPTAFSPNGDGVNDTFVPFASLNRVARITSMQLFDRWGESVFFNEDFAPNDLLAGWDGTLNGRPLNPKVLVYAVEVEFLNGETRLFKGDVTLLR